MSQRSATIVTDLGFGDAGKGTVVDYLARQSATPTIVRFNGGAQAAHNVVTAGGRHHTFSQFGSGTFVPGVRTHLSRFMLIDLPVMVNEAQHLQELGCGQVLSRLTVDEQALVVSPFMKAANQIRETLRGDGRHGSCGMGIGETTAHSLAYPDDAIRARDLRQPDVLLKKLQHQQELKYQEFSGELAKLANHPLVSHQVKLLLEATEPNFWANELRRLATFPIVPGEYLRTIAKRSNLIFEGAQGVLIDEWYGFDPYTTWSTCTNANALTLLNEIQYDGAIERLGVLRAYFVRHGPGPFPTESLDLTKQLPDRENTTGPWQGKFRVGWFDSLLARYAIDVSGGVDGIALTHLDRWASIANPKVATSYRIDTEPVFTLPRNPVQTDLSWQRQLTERLNRAVPDYRPALTTPVEYIAQVEEITGHTIRLTSSGPTAQDKQETSLLQR